MGAHHKNLQLHINKFLFESILLEVERRRKKKFLISMLKKVIEEETLNCLIKLLNRNFEQLNEKIRE